MEKRLKKYLDMYSNRFSDFLINNEVNVWTDFAISLLIIFLLGSVRKIIFISV